MGVLLSRWWGFRPEVDLSGAPRPAGIRPQCGHGGTVVVEYLVTLQQVHASHLWPDSDDRTRDAIDSFLGSTADPLRTKGLSTS